MPYRYEVHMHTAESSKCGKTHAADYIAEFKKLGYDGIIITDHFYHGNTAIDRDLPWPEFVSEFCRGYEIAKAEGDRQGFKVFFGWEENHDCDEYLIYGLDKDWLIAHPEIRDADQAETLRLVHEGGGLVVQAHPFRERSYVTDVNVHPYQCDAMEACNWGNPPYQDILAYTYAQKNGIKLTSGSDLHDVANLATSQAGMVFDKPLESIHDYVDAVLSGQGYTPMIPEDRRHMQPDTVNTLPLVLWDRDNVKHRITLDDLELR